MTLKIQPRAIGGVAAFAAAALVTHHLLSQPKELISPNDAFPVTDMTRIQKALGAPTRVSGQSITLDAHLDSKFQTAVSSAMIKQIEDAFSTSPFLKKEANYLRARGIRLVTEDPSRFGRAQADLAFLLPDGSIGISFIAFHEVTNPSLRKPSEDEAQVSATGNLAANVFLPHIVRELALKLDRAELADRLGTSAQALAFTLEFSLARARLEIETMNKFELNRRGSPGVEVGNSTVWTRRSSRFSGLDPDYLRSILDFYAYRAGDTRSTRLRLILTEPSLKEIEHLVRDDSPGSNLKFCYFVKMHEGMLVYGPNFPLIQRDLKKALPSKELERLLIQRDQAWFGKSRELKLPDFDQWPELFERCKRSPRAGINTLRGIIEEWRLASAALNSSPWHEDASSAYQDSILLLTDFVARQEKLRTQSRRDRNYFSEIKGLIEIIEALEEIGHIHRSPEFQSLLLTTKSFPNPNSDYYQTSHLNAEQRRVLDGRFTVDPRVERIMSGVKLEPREREFIERKFAFVIAGRSDHWNSERFVQAIDRIARKPLEVRQAYLQVFGRDAFRFSRAERSSSTLDSDSTDDEAFRILQQAQDEEILPLLISLYCRPFPPNFYDIEFGELHLRYELLEFMKKLDPSIGTVSRSSLLKLYPRVTTLADNVTIISSTTPWTVSFGTELFDRFLGQLEARGAVDSGFVDGFISDGSEMVASINEEARSTALGEESKRYSVRKRYEFVVIPKLSLGSTSLTYSELPGAKVLILAGQDSEGDETGRFIKYANRMRESFLNSGVADVEVLSDISPDSLDDAVFNITSDAARPLILVITAHGISGLGPEFRTQGRLPAAAVTSGSFSLFKEQDPDGNTDLSEAQLIRLANYLGAKSKSVTVILDSCHSGAVGERLR